MLLPFKNSRVLKLKNINIATIVLVCSIIHSCQINKTQKVVIETDKKLYKDFNRNQLGQCNYSFEFNFKEKLEDGQNSCHLIEIKTMNDSIVLIKTYKVEDKIKKLTGNMGKINLKAHLKNKNIEDFIILIYQKAFGCSD